MGTRGGVCLLPTDAASKRRHIFKADAELLVTCVDALTVVVVDALVLGHNLLLDLWRNWIVMAQLDRIRTLSSGRRLQSGLIVTELG